MIYLTKDVIPNQPTEVVECKEFFTVQTVLDVDGNEVQIPQSIGTFYKNQIEQDISMLNQQVENINKNIAEKQEMLKEFN